MVEEFEVFRSMNYEGTSVPISGVNILKEHFRTHNIRHVVEEVATRPGYDICFADLIGAGYVLASEVPEFLIRITDSKEEQGITILHELLHIKYPSDGDVHTTRDRWIEYNDLIDREAQRAVREDPSLPDYLLSKARKVTFDNKEEARNLLERFTERARMQGF